MQNRHATGYEGPAKDGQVIRNDPVPNPLHERPLGALGSQDDAPLWPVPHGGAEPVKALREHG
eukprot:6735974-Alexandrium_andersonii.AAC.1